MQIPMQMSSSESLLLGLLRWSIKQGTSMSFKPGPTSDMIVTLGQTMAMTFEGCNHWV
jgi:hypothetical protein